MLYEYSSIYEKSNYRCILKDIMVDNGLVRGKLVGVFYGWDEDHEPQYYAIEEASFYAHSLTWTLIEYRGKLLSNTPNNS